MARSIVSWQGERDGFQEFDADVGSNRFYAWGVGSGVSRRDGVPVLASRSATSPLVGPVPPGGRGRVVLRVPTDAFTRDDHHLQLLSFRDEELRGPAASDIVEVPWRWTRPEPESRDRPRDREDGAMSLAYATGRRAMPAPRPAGSRQSAPVPPLGVAFSGRLPGSPRMSEAQFLGALGGLISQVLPIVQQAMPIIQQALPIVGQIGQALAPPAAAAPVAGAPAAGGSAGGGAAGGGAAARPDLGTLLANLLGQVEKLTHLGQPAAAPPTPQTPAAQQHSLARSASAQRYSYASVAPLLAALPALAPLLQSVLSPQTVQSLVSAADPNRLLQTTFAGLMDAAKIGQQATDALHAHLRALNPGTGDDVLIPLLLSMSTGASTARPTSSAPRHRRSRVVRLEVPDLAPVELQGYPQVAFRWGEDITIPVSVRTPRRIRRARLQVCVKDVASQVVVAERTTRLATVEDGRLDPPVHLPGAVTHRLRPGREYLVCLRLLWPGHDGLMGTTTAQLVRLVGPAVFDSVDSGGKPVRLDDVDRDRDWWHQVWADTVEERSSRVRARLDYEYRLAASGRDPANKRRETRVDLDPATSRRSEGTLRAGLDITVASLSRLAQRLDGEAFDEDTVRALQDPAFRAAFDRTAGCEVSLHGRRHSRMAVWVWPEVKLHDVFLRTPGEVSPTTGQVLSFEMRPVKVPIPALAHVLTTRSS